MSTLAPWPVLSASIGELGDGQAAHVRHPVLWQTWCGLSDDEAVPTASGPTCLRCLAAHHRAERLLDHATSADIPALLLAASVLAAVAHELDAASQITPGPLVPFTGQAALRHSPVASSPPVSGRDARATGPGVPTTFHETSAA